MKKQDYIVTIVADITANKAFENITNVSGWWTQNLEGHSKKLNDEFTVYFGDVYSTQKLVEVIPDKKIVWLVTDCRLTWLKDKTEWKGTQMIFEISRAKDKTEIRFTHIGLVPGIECYNSCTKGWDHYIEQSLFKLVTEGKGLPEIKQTANA